MSVQSELEPPSDPSATPQQPPEKENYTQILWKLAWPVVALNALQTLNVLVDRFFIGHLDLAALTAHGGALNIMFFMVSIALATGTSATALVSRAFGAGKKNEYTYLAGQSLTTALLLSLALAAITFLIAPWAASLLLPATDTAAIRQMREFLQLYSLGIPAIFVIQTMAGSFRAVGDSKSAMYLSGLQIVLHVALNFFLILPPHQWAGMHIPSKGLGLHGTALALSISASIAAIVYVLWSSRTALGTQWRLKRPRWSFILRFLKIAVPAAGMSIMRVTALMAFTLVIVHLPNASIGIAAMTTGFALEPILFMPSFGLSAATAALVGQSLGMKQPQRAEKLGWLASHFGALITLLLCIPVYLFANDLAMLLVNGKVAVATEAAQLLRILCLTEVGSSYGMIMIGAMQGAGDTVRPFWITFIAMWIIRVPLAIYLSYAPGTAIFNTSLLQLTLSSGPAMGITGAWISLAVTQALHGVACTWAFNQGKWKHKRV